MISPASRQNEDSSGSRLHVNSRSPTLECGLTNRWSGRVKDKVPSSDIGARAAQLNREASQACATIHRR